MAAVPGTSIEESQRIGALVTEALLKLPFVRVVSQRIGRAEQADDTWGTHYSEFEVDLQRGPVRRASRRRRRPRCARCWPAFPAPTSR